MKTNSRLWILSNICFGILLIALTIWAGYVTLVSFRDLAAYHSWEEDRKVCITLGGIWATDRNNVGRCLR